MKSTKITISSIGELIVAMLNHNVAPEGSSEHRVSNDEILSKVHEVFPSSKTTKACVSWYVSKLKKSGTPALPAKSSKAPVEVTL